MSSTPSSCSATPAFRPPIRVGGATPIAPSPRPLHPTHRPSAYALNSMPYESSTLFSTPTPRIAGSTPVCATPRTLHQSTLLPGVVDPFFGRVLSPADHAYIREFTSWSSSRLDKEPRVLALESQRLQSQLESLSLDNYPTFLHTSAVLKQAERSLNHIDRHMSEVHTHIVPSLQSHCASVQDRSTNFIAASDAHRLMLKHQSFLLELLEIPQLMDTCFKSATAPNTSEREKNKLINDALALDAHVKLIGDQYARWSAQQRTEKDGDVDSSAADPASSSNFQSSSIPPLLQSVQLELLSMKRNIVNHLLMQLRGNISAITEEEELDPTAIAEGKKPNIITIPEVVVGIRIVGLLKRTLALFGDATGHLQAPHVGGRDDATSSLIDIHSSQDLILKYQFLRARNAYFESVLSALVPPNLNGNNVVPPSSTSATSNSSSSHNTNTQHLVAFKYLDSYIALHRTHLFNITTLYSALFLDAEDASSNANSTSGDTRQQKQHDQIGLVCRWMHRRLDIMIGTLETYLPSITDGASLSTLLSSCSSCALGLSRSKIGFDFRSLVVPIFERRVRDMFAINLIASVAVFDHALAESAWFIPTPNLRRLGLAAPKQAAHLNDAISTHLTALLPYPPLAILANGIVTAINELAKCAPVILAESSATTLQKTIDTIIHKLKSLPTTAPRTNGTIGTADGESESLDPISQLAQATHSHLIPLVAALFTHVYPSCGGLFSLPRLLASISVMIAVNTPAEADLPPTTTPANHTSDVSSLPSASAPTTQPEITEDTIHRPMAMHD